jgi:hypothetical protein
MAAGPAGDGAWRWLAELDTPGGIRDSFANHYRRRR